MDKEIEKAAALEAMKWYGWGSPVGLTIFFIGISSLILSIKHVIDLFRN